MNMYQDLSLDPKYAGYTGKDLENEAFVDEIVKNFINPSINQRGKWINNINREIPRLLKLVREIFNDLLKLDYLFGSDDKRDIHIKFQDILGKMNKFMQETMKEILRIQDVAQERRNIITTMLLRQLTKQTLKKFQSGLGSMEKFAEEIDSNGNVIYVENQNNWTAQLNSILNNFKVKDVESLSIINLWNNEDPYLIPLNFYLGMMILRLPSFGQFPEVFLELMIKTYIASQNSYPVDLKLYTSTKNRKIPEINELRELYNIQSGSMTYKKRVDELLQYLKPPKVKNLRLFISTFLAHPAFLLNTTPSEEQLKQFVEQNKDGLTPLFDVDPYHLDLVMEIAAYSVSNLNGDIRENMPEFANLYQANQILNLPNIGRAVKRGKGTVVNDSLPMYLDIDPTMILEPDGNNCCMFEVDVPKNTPGIIFTDNGFFIPPCSEFIVKEHNDKEKKGRLVYKGSKLKPITKNQFIEMMRDYNTHHNKLMELHADVTRNITELKSEIRTRLNQVEGIPEEIISMMLNIKNTDIIVFMNSLTTQLNLDQLEAINPIFTDYLMQMSELVSNMNEQKMELNIVLLEKYHKMIEDFIQMCRGRSIQTGGGSNKTRVSYKSRKGRH